MNSERKAVDALTLEDITGHRVWQFVSSDQPDETFVEPVTEVPVNITLGKLFGSEVRLNNGSLRWAILGNISNIDAHQNLHFITLSVYEPGHWIYLPRYHDLDYSDFSPDEFALALGLKKGDVFPIIYDLRELASGSPDALVGQIDALPRERLTDQALMTMSLK